MRNLIDRRMNKILQYYVNNQSKVVELIELDTRIKTINREMQEIEQYNKNYVDNQRYIELQALRDSFSDAKLTIEGLVSTLDKENTIRVKVDRSEEFTNFYKSPVVIHRKGEAIGVVQPGASFKVNKGDSGVLNGKRFEVVDNVVHRDAKAHFNAFGGLARIGNREMSYDKQQGYIEAEFRNFMRDYVEVFDIYRDRPVSPHKFPNRAAEIETLLHERLSNMTDPLDRKAFIYRMLTPAVNKEVIAITSDTSLPGSNTTFDYAFKNNSKLQSLVLSYLSSKANGEKYQQGMSKGEAVDLIQSIAHARNLWNQRLFDGTLVLESGASTDVLTRKPRVGETVDQSALSLPTDFLKKIYTDKLNDTRLFKNLQGWITGKKLLNPGELFRVTEEFRKHGFLESEMFFNNDYIIKPDGTLEMRPEGSTIGNTGNIHRGSSIFNKAGKFGNPGTQLDQSPLDHFNQGKNHRENC